MFWIFVCIGSSLLSPVTTSNEELLMVVEVTRHGARAPLKKWFGKSWSQGLQLGELTSVGMRQHYLLGKELASRYPGLFGNQLRAEEFYVRSSAISRTQISAISHLLGMWDHFRPLKLPFENGDPRIQPAGQYITPDSHPFNTPLPFGLLVSPIHSEYLEEDYLLRPFSESTCPTRYPLVKAAYDQIAQELESDQQFQQLVKEATGRFGYAWDGKDALKTCYEVADFALQDAANNPSPTITDSDPLFRKIARCYHFSIGGVNEVEEYRRVLNAPIVLDIIRVLKDKVNKNGNKLKYVYYSGHDVNVAALQSLFGQLDFRCIKEDLLAKSSDGNCGIFPELASNIILELSTERDIEYIKLKLNFEPIDFCNLHNPDRQFRCELSDFSYKLQQKVDTNWQEYCGYQSKSVAEQRFKPIKPAYKSTSLFKFYAALVVFINLVVLSVIIKLIKTKFAPATQASRSASILREDKL